MISIVYCERDFEAAGIALKVQSLSQNQPVRIYIVPKHYGRNQEEIQRNLLQTTVAVFLAHDVGTLDAATKSELDFLVDAGIPIKYIVPSNYRFLGFNRSIDNGSVYRYAAQKSDADTIVEDIAATLNELQSQLHDGQLKFNLVQQSKSRDSAGAVGLIILLAIVLLGLLVSSEE